MPCGQRTPAHALRRVQQQARHPPPPLLCGYAVLRPQSDAQPRPRASLSALRRRSRTRLCPRKDRHAYWAFQVDRASQHDQWRHSGGSKPKQAAYVDEEERMLGQPLLDDAWEVAACRCRHQKSAQSGRDSEAGACDMVGGGRTPRTRRTSPCTMTYRQQSPADL
jgi:hypothetical protein